MKRAFRVGLTGGIGSGKSRVAERLAMLGADVIDTDVIARDLTAAGGAAMPAIRAAFGDPVVASDGSLDRRRLREFVFADPEARQRLESILHPLIRAEVVRRLAGSTAVYAVVVVPLLVETGAYDDLIDRVLVVDCDPDQQVARVVARDRVSAEAAGAVLAAQVGRAARLAVADDVLDNRGEPDALAPAVDALHGRYLAMARGQTA